ncbi:hypothetical protein CCACVL1_09295 [Corchorus capsularis]|uniref:Uncharacterized protein n=1 Tax=Corchorus capsularis TaxID=210143 RepID=A0A1R3IWY2_COCAP|nr:hypothetical protein CCACVL1_09295 [Corchorus capsularis]
MSTTTTDIPAPLQVDVFKQKDAPSIDEKGRTNR